MAQRPICLLFAARREVIVPRGTEGAALPAKGLTAGCGCSLKADRLQRAPKGRGRREEDGNFCAVRSPSKVSRGTNGRRIRKIGGSQRFEGLLVGTGGLLEGGEGTSSVFSRVALVVIRARLRGETGPPWEVAREGASD